MAGSPAPCPYGPVDGTMAAGGGRQLEPHAIARMLAVGGTVQELTGSTPLVGANQVFRIWRKDRNFILKVYGSDSRQRREAHALHALGDVDHLPKILDRGVHDGTHWITFEDAGRWNLQSLPENPGLARAAGQILRVTHQADAKPFSNLARGIDGEWVAVDFQSSIRRLERYRGRVGVTQAQIEAALSVNPPFASTPVVAHTAPEFRNFLVDDEGWLTLRRLGMGDPRSARVGPHEARVVCVHACGACRS